MGKVGFLEQRKTNVECFRGSEISTSWEGVLIGVKETAEVLVVRRLVPLLGRVSGVYTGVTYGDTCIGEKGREGLFSKL